MKIENASEMYNKIINGNNEELFIKWNEAVKERKKLNIITIIILTIVDIIILNIGSRIIYSSNMANFIAILIVDIVLYSISLAFGKKKKEFNKEFKTNIVNKIISNFYDNLEYFPDKMMPRHIYNEPCYEEYDEYYSEDYMEAKVDSKYEIIMAEVLTEEIETYTDSDGDRQTSKTTLFHGLFAKIDMQKSINSTLDIKPNLKFNLIKKNKLEMDSRRI